MNNLILLDPYIIERDGPVPPVIWDVDERNGIRYEDIKADRYEETIEFLCNNFFGYETLCRSVGLLNDADALRDMCNLFRFLLREECSIAMIDLESDRIVGVAIMKIMWKSDYSWPFWRLLAPLTTPSSTTHQKNSEGEEAAAAAATEATPNAAETPSAPTTLSGCTKIVGFQCEFMKYSQHLHTKLDTSFAVHAYAVALARHMKGRLLKEQLLLNAYKVARSVGVKSFTWMCTSRNDQERALRVGMRKIDQKNYGTYTDAQERKIFTNLDPGEHYASLFGLPVEDRAATSLGDYLFPEYELLDENGRVIAHATTKS